MTPALLGCMLLVAAPLNSEVEERQRQEEARRLEGQSLSDEVGGLRLAVRRLIRKKDNSLYVNYVFLWTPGMDRTYTFRRPWGVAHVDFFGPSGVVGKQVVCRYCVTMNFIHGKEGESQCHPEIDVPAGATHIVVSVEGELITKKVRIPR